MCCFFAKHAAIRRLSKDWLARNQDNVSECVDISIHELLFQWASIIKNTTKRVGLVQSGPYHHFIEINLFSPWYSWTIVELALSNNHSLTQSIWTFLSFPFGFPFPSFSIRNTHYVRCLLYLFLAGAIWEESYRYI